MGGQAQAAHRRPTRRAPAGRSFTTWLFMTTAVDGIADPNAAPIVDGQVANWLCAQRLASLRVNRTPDYERYLELLKDRASGQGARRRCGP
ncbi:hypothetical protein [Micromonospora sp. LOL_023]|uniref:8-oxoguanine DNA glycosylase OGG fold protein n=1 Tax=Micromonospora sp. LOL_023 TaxID=3345418 RepID=UPI003A83E829